MNPVETALDSYYIHGELMLALTKRTEYALIAFAHLARSGGAVVSARDIAGRYTMRLPLLMNVLKSLNQKGLLKSVRGVKGGYSLGLPSDKILLSAVICAVEGPVRLVRCVQPEPASEHGDGNGERACELAGCCPVRKPIQRVHEFLRSFLERVTLADIASEDDDPARFARLEPMLHESLKVLAK